MITCIIIDFNICIIYLNQMRFSDCSLQYTVLKNKLMVYVCAF